jgi:hypothetical protein
VIPERRQNCYLAIICFLLACRVFGDRHSSSGEGSGGSGGAGEDMGKSGREGIYGNRSSTLLAAPLKEFFVEVLGDI